MHRSILFLYSCIGFLCGVAAASFLVLQTFVTWAFVLVGALLLLARRPRATVIGIALFAVALGVWRANTIFETPSALWQLASSKPLVTLIGSVDGDFEATKTGGRYTFHVLRVQIGETSITADDRALIMGPDWIRPRQGQVLVVQGKLQRPSSFDDFDYASYLAKDGIHATMYFPQYSVPEDFQMPRMLRARLWLTGTLAAVRFSLTESVARAVPQPESGYLTGILVGAKGVVGADIKDAFSRTGTSHILAISGYNITIVASVLMLLLARLGRRWSYWLAIFGIVLFTIMVGAGASVVRAAIMGVLAITAQRLGRLNNAGSAMAFSAAVMCWCNPLLLRWDVGFQLSFLAFAGIVYVEPLLKPTLERWLKWKYIAGLLATTLSAQVLVLPILLYTFNQLAIYTLPANVLILPFVPLAMALGFATAVAGLLWPMLGALVGQTAWLIAAYQLGVVRLFASLPYAALEVHISAALLIALYVGLVSWLILVYKKHGGA